MNNKIHKSFENIFEVPCVSKFRVLRSSVRFEVPCASKFRVLRSSVRFEVPCGNRENNVTTLVCYLENRLDSLLNRFTIIKSTQG